MENDMVDNLEIIFFYEENDRSKRLYWSGVINNKLVQEPPIEYVKELIGKKLYELSLRGMIKPVREGQLVAVENVRLYVIGVPYVIQKSYPLIAVIVKKWDVFGTSV